MKFVAGIIIAAANANTLNPGKRLILEISKSQNSFHTKAKTDPELTRTQPKSTETRIKPFPDFNSHIP